MAQLFNNNANSKLVAGISNVSLSLQIAAGDGMKFPNPTGGDFFLVTLSKITSGIEASVEIVKVTARATDVFTIVRAQEGTTALVYAEGDSVSLRVTAGVITSTEAHKDSVGNPHATTKTQVGLSNVDNTSDANKPVSTLQAAAIASATYTHPANHSPSIITQDALNRFVTDAEKTTWNAKQAAGTYATGTGSASGVNTGDETGAGIRTKLGIATLSGSNTGDQTLPTLSSLGGQAALVSGTNIKTVNSTSLLGSGNIVTGDVTLAGTQTLTNKTITDIVFTLTGTTPAFTATNGAVQTWTLSGASTPTNALTTGQSIILVITPGANTITWPAGTVWTKQGGSGAAPTLFSAGKTSVVLWRVGAVLYGSHLGDTV